MESRRNGPQLSSRHDDDDDVNTGKVTAADCDGYHVIGESSLPAYDLMVMTYSPLALCLLVCLLCIGLS